MRFPPYSNYKESGVEWLGQVPNHWKVDRIKASVESARNGIWGEESDGGALDIPCVRVADFDRKALSVKLNVPTMRKVTEKERSGRILSMGDLLLEKSGGGEGQPVGCVVLYEDDKPAICSNFVAKVELANDMDSSYWRYVHAAAYSIRLTTCSINQTSGIQNLDQAAYFNEKAVFPPNHEQKVIARFLDYETAKIDALIREQQRLIDLLSEKRFSTISHAVLMGIDTRVRMVPLLGSEGVFAPEGWMQTVIKRLATLQRGHDLTNDERVDGPYPVVTSSGENGFHNSYMCKGPGVVTGRYGSTGKVFYIESDFWPHNTSLYVNDFHENLPRFVWYFFQTVDFAAHSEKSAVPGIDRNDIHVLPVAVPPIGVQKEIFEFLDGETKKIDGMLAEASRNINLLTERRASLVSAAVTGKIDVRGFVAPAIQ